MKITARMKAAVGRLMMSTVSLAGLNALAIGYALSVVRHPEREFPVPAGWSEAAIRWAVIGLVCAMLLLSMILLRLHVSAVGRCLRGNEECSRCGYDLRGSHLRCPECGTPIGEDHAAGQ